MHARSASIAPFLPQLDRMSVRLRRCAARMQRRELLWSSRVPEIRVEEVPAGPIGADAMFAQVETPWGGIGLAVEPHQWPSLAMAASLPDAATRKAVASLLFMGRLQALAVERFAVDLRVTAPPSTHGSGLALRCGEARLDIVHVDESLMAFVEQHGGDAASELPLHALGWQLPSTLVLGVRAMPRDVLASLRCGDLILLPLLPDMDAGSLYGADRMTCQLAWGSEPSAGLRAGVLLTHTTTMTLIEAPHEDGGTPATAGLLPGEAPAQDSVRHALARLELPVKFEVAGPTLKLADIAGLRRDDVLELSEPVDQARVRITVAGQCVGVGELVAVGRRLGVRVQSLNALPPGEGAL